MSEMRESMERDYAAHRSTRQDVNERAVQIEVGGVTPEQVAMAAFAEERARAAELGMRVVEILDGYERNDGPGSVPQALQRIIRAALKLGFLPAQPGEERKA